jgi:adenylate kinase
MAPITDNAVNDLKQLVQKLENRISELESKLDGGKSSSSSEGAGSMRMILMGPPGAGMLMPFPSRER